MSICQDYVHEADELLPCYEEAATSISMAIDTLMTGDRYSRSLAEDLQSILDDVNSMIESYEQTLDEYEEENKRAMLSEYWRSVI